MIRFLRRSILVIVYAVLGAVAGRVAMDLRRRHAEGEPLQVKLDASSLRPQEIIPGLIAALRVRDRPWSYLHIPGWFAAFTVNFAVSALGRELQPPADDELDEAAGVYAATVETRSTVTPGRDDTPAEGAAGPAADAPTGFTPFND
ncbi:MAG: hypothetical protein OXC71_08400 [Chloroflexi bacterium]|nr:hypothetical protein [Chloroflexota bacterium]